MPRGANYCKCGHSLKSHGSAGCSAFGAPVMGKKGSSDVTMSSCTCTTTRRQLDEPKH
jgi:hypothetical protein